MIKLYDTGAYLLNGTELVPDTSDARAVLESKLGGRRLPKRRQPEIPLPMEFWQITIHQAIWTSCRLSSTS